jgi:transcriptional regulator with XRE-family HTH domain
MTDEIKWSHLDAQRLQQLRREAGLTVPDLANASGISEAQIRQLEEDGESLFYSPRIKYTVGKRLILQLIEQTQSKNSPPQTSSSPRVQTYKDAHQTLLAIEEMSRRNLNASPVTDFYWRARQEIVRLLQSKYVLASLAMVMVMVSVVLFESPDSEEAKNTHDQPSPLLTLTKSMIVPVFQINDWAQAQWSALFLQNNKAQPLSPDSKTTVTAFVKPGLATDLAQPPPPTQAHTLDPEPKLGLNGEAHALKAQSEDLPECHFSPQGGTEVVSTSTYRPATYVYLVAKKNTTVCIQDGLHAISQVKLTEGASQSVYGSPPWHLRLQDLDAVDVFFQGRRITLPPSENAQFTLIQFAQDLNH